MSGRMTSGMSFARLCRARERLRDPGGRIPLGTIADEVGLSTGELIRRFTALFGETPHQYRLRERLDRAKELLACGALSVTGICMEVGFSSVGSFSAWFARRVGEPPSTYRRRVRPNATLPASSPASLHAGCLSLLAGALSQPAAYRDVAESAISEKHESRAAGTFERSRGDRAPMELT
jgi:AraC-like DNA-binding protein